MMGYVLETRTLRELKVNDQIVHGEGFARVTELTTIGDNFVKVVAKQRYKRIEMTEPGDAPVKVKVPH